MSYSVAQGLYIQSLMDNDGRKYKRMYIRLAHFAVQQKMAQHCQSTILKKKKDTTHSMYDPCIHSCY